MHAVLSPFSDLCNKPKSSLLYKSQIINEFLDREVIGKMNVVLILEGISDI
jgi:hypothetical protein